MFQKLLIFSITIFLLIAGIFIYRNNSPISNNLANSESNTDSEEDSGGLINQLHPLSIESLRAGEYPGSDIVIEQVLPPGSNYQRYLTSYKSEGLKIYALLTVPSGEKPESGFPVVIFNHGYIPPAEYRTTERYIAYTDAFSRAGYVLFRPDYRGHGNSEGSAAGGYGSNAYTVDVLNALGSVKRLKESVILGSGAAPESGNEIATASPNNDKLVDINRIGMWGHSMGGHITLRNMVTSKDMSKGSCCAIKAGVIWAGVVASYPDLVERWRRRSPMASSLPGNVNRGGWRNSLIEQYGQPSDNPEFWNSISANSYLNEISGPLQLHHGTADTSVPVEFSEKLDQQMKAAGKESEIYIYPGDDHNLAANLGLALQRSVAFFDKHLKEY